MLLVIDGLYIAGAQRHCLELLEVFNQCGLACTVLALEGGGRWADRFLSKAERVLIAQDRTMNWASLQSYLGYSDFEFVSAHLVVAAEWIVNNVPTNIHCFAHLHSEPSEHELISPQFLRSIVRRFDSIFVPTNVTREWFIQEMASLTSIKSDINKFQALPNGLEKDNMHVPLSQPSDNILHLAVVSRIDTDKFSISLFTETVTRVRQAYPFMQVRVAGDGELMQELHRAIATSEIAEIVTLLGFVDDVASLYAWADVVFLPSKRESMPYVLVECIATVRPLVAPSVGIFRNFKVPDALFTFAPDNSQEASAAIQLAAASRLHTTNPWGENKMNGILNFDQWAYTVKKSYGFL